MGKPRDNQGRRLLGNRKCANRISEGPPRESRDVSTSLDMTNEKKERASSRSVKKSQRERSDIDRKTERGGANGNAAEEGRLTVVLARVPYFEDDWFVISFLGESCVNFV